MTTPDQIEAVARAIADAIDEQDSRVVLDDMPAIARDAIAAYEANRHVPEWQTDPRIEHALLDSSGTLTLWMTLGGWDAQLVHPVSRVIRQGTGPTIADAIQNALEGEATT